MKCTPGCILAFILVANLAICKLSIGQQNRHLTYALHGGFNFMAPGSRLEYTGGERIIRLRSNAKYSMGLLGNYPLKDGLVLESGVVWAKQFFSANSRKVGQYGAIPQFFGLSQWYQHGLEFPLRVKLEEAPVNVYRKRVQLVAGGGWQRIYSGIIDDRNGTHRRAGKAYNILHITIGIRMINAWARWGKLEYGVQYDYSTLEQTQGFTTDLEDLPNNTWQPINHFRIGVYYFMPNKGYAPVPSAPPGPNPRKL